MSKGKIKLVKMENKETGIKADVHPDMVDEYAKGGFVKMSKPAQKIAKSE